ILMLTAKDDEDDKITGLNLGADDYLTKPFSPKEVIARINAILRRTAKDTTTSSITIGELFIYPEKHEAFIHDETIIYNKKEYELLLYLAKKKGKVLFRGKILKAVCD